jgi:hypothetical protein
MFPPEFPMFLLAARDLRTRVVYSPFFFGGEMFVRLPSCPGISIPLRDIGAEFGQCGREISAFPDGTS